MNWSKDIFLNITLAGVNMESFVFRLLSFQCSAFEHPATAPSVTNFKCYLFTLSYMPSSIKLIVRKLELLQYLFYFPLQYVVQLGQLGLGKITPWLLTSSIDFSCCLNPRGREKNLVFVGSSAMPRCTYYIHLNNKSFLTVVEVVAFYTIRFLYNVHSTLKANLCLI